MKNLLILALFLTSCVIAFSWPISGNIPSPTGSTWGWDDVLKQWRPNAVAAPYTAYQTTPATAGVNSATITVMLGRTFVAITNIGAETVWINPGGTAATVSAGLPILAGQYWTDHLDASIPVAYRASATTAISVTQGR